MPKLGNKLAVLLQLFDTKLVVCRHESGIILLKAVGVKEVRLCSVLMVVFVVVFVDESSHVFVNIQGAHLLDVELATVLDTGPILRYRVLFARLND